MVLDLVSLAIFLFWLERRIQAFGQKPEFIPQAHLTPTKSFKKLYWRH